MNDYIICTQNIKGGTFGNEPDKATYLKVPSNSPTFLPKYKISTKEFVTDIVDQKVENIVIFIHGYNTEDADVLERHRTLKGGLHKAGFTGDLISIAWPSNDKALLYLEDRHDTKRTAFELVNKAFSETAK